MTFLKKQIKLTRLLEPGQIGEITTRNRLIKCANGTSFIEPTGFLGDRVLAHYEALARGGVGLLIVESCGVEYPLGVQHPPYQFRLDEDIYIPSYRKLVDIIHKYSCPAFIQLQHAGPWDPTRLLQNRETKAPSTLTKEELPGPDFYPPKEFTHNEIKDYINIWAKAAERAAEAGFDGVELNGATCHQINTFFSRVWNRRVDEYGSETLENRARYMCDIVREIKKRCGNDFAVTCLINVAEYGQQKGTTPSEGVQFSKFLQEAGADAIQCRVYFYGKGRSLLQPDRLLYPERPHWLPEELDWSKKGAGAFVPLAEKVREKVSIPVFCAGRLDHELGEKFLEEGKMDFVGMVRRLLADPELPNKLVAGKFDHIIPCTGCLYCRDVRNKNQPIACMVNPNLGKEREYTLRPAKTKKKVMVIGGGPAGMQAAIISAQRGHEVTIYEKDEKFGGKILTAIKVKEHDADALIDFVNYLERQMHKAGVNTKLNKNVNSGLVRRLKPDVIILATGGATSVPNIFLKPLSNIVAFNASDSFTNSIGRKVAVIGGDNHGCQIAEFLVKQGREVIILYTGETLGEGMTEDEKTRFSIWFGEKEVTVFTGIEYKEVTNKEIVIITKDGQYLSIAVESIVLSPLMVENTRNFKRLVENGIDVYPIGSCVKPKPDLIVHAIADGASVGHMI